MAFDPKTTQICYTIIQMVKKFDQEEEEDPSPKITNCSSTEYF